MMLPAKVIATDADRDAVLWKEMKNGNESAFREIFDNYSNLLLQYGITINTDRELVKDCIQELFITVWTNRRTIGVARSIKYYLVFSLRRLILKKSRLGRRLFSFASNHHLNLTVESAHEMIVRKEMHLHNKLLISGAVDLLPPRQKEIIFLKFYQQLDYEDIQKIMNLNNQVVRNTLCKALGALRSKLAKKQTHAQFMFLPIAGMYFAIGF